MTPQPSPPGSVSDPGTATVGRRNSGGVSTRRIGMRLFLLSLSILFVACLIGILVIRLRAEQWPPPGSPEIPGGLWISTAILAVLSTLLVLAVRATRAGRAAEASRLLAASTALGVAFLAAQTSNWFAMAGEGDDVQKTMLAFAFWMLTVLHGLHVLGGLVPLSITTVRAAQGRYLSDPEPVELVADYWHFLGITWLAIFAVLAL